MKLKTGQLKIIIIYQAAKRDEFKKENGLIKGGRLIINKP